MKLIIGNQPIALFLDSELSMEKLSPALNDNVGSYSYPFAVPTQPNQHKLGWPGKLERTGALPSKPFIVEDSGMQVLRGEIQYDSVSKTDIGIILTSGATEFYTLLEKLKNDGDTLGDLDWGSESWFSDQPTTWELWQEKLSAWDTNNRAENAPFVVAPFQYYAANGTIVLGNKHDAEGYLTQEYADLETSFMYMLQFRAWWMVEKIFEAFGYTVTMDELKLSEWKQLVILSRPFLITLMPADPELFPNQILVHPAVDEMEYAYLMPTVSAMDFIEEIRVLMGLAFDIDDMNKQVKILQIKNIISPGDSVTELTELSGWEHKEGQSTAGDGYSISYMTQDDELDNRSDYKIDATFANNSEAPVIPPSEGYVVRITSSGRDYISVKNSEAELVWAQIGRLKPFVSGEQKTTIEIGVKVAAPSLDGSTLFKGPRFNYLEYLSTTPGMTTYNLSEIYCSLYRGMITNFVITDIPFQTVPIPLISSDKWIATETLYLSPQGIYNSVYADFLNWKASNARSFTKYIRLTLPELMALEWNSRYVISGVKVLLSKINYDLPFTGIAKVEGYVS